jgi:hypothetical protein
VDFCLGTTGGKSMRRPRLLRLIPELKPQMASLAGIAAATIMNFVALKFVVFKQRHYRPRGSGGRD